MDVFDHRTCRLGEGPIWHPLRGELFWVDIPDRQVLCAGMEGQREHTFEEMVSALGWIDEETMLLATESGLYRLAIADWSTQLICPVEADMPDNRSNDGRADPWGGFWIGTMSKTAEAGAGSFYRYYDGTLRLQVPGITITNGLCFDRNRSIGYCTDSAAKRTWRMALDENGWLAGEPEVFLDFTEDGTTIDGAIIDCKGNMWCAIFDGGEVLQISPEGEILNRIATQTPRVTCPAFGGVSYRDLIVTSAAIGLPPAESDAVQHGATLRFCNIVDGAAEPQVRL